MYRNYIKTAFRAFVKNKAFTIINIIGLAVGIGCVLLITAYLYNEFSYDRFHTNAGKLCRITLQYRFGDGESVNIATSPTAAVPAFVRAFPEVTAGARLAVADAPVPVQYGDKIFNERKFLYADSSFFTMFSFPLLQGNPATALKEPNTIVITVSAARKYFGSENAMGKVIRVNNNRDMLITGIAADVPDNSQIKFNFAGSFSSLNASKTETWGSANYTSYLLLNRKEDLPAVQKKINAFVQKELSGELSKGDYVHFSLEPLTRVHLYSSATGGIEPTGNATAMYLLGVVALLLLFIACINFMNLATARSAERSLEIGIRKTIGAAKTQLFWQFITESAVITFFAIVLGVAFAKLSLPLFNHITERSLPLAMGGHTSWLVMSLLLLFAGITFLAGTYPALFLAAFQPLKVLKQAATAKAGGTLLRKSLVVVQFAISSFLIVCTLVVVKQRWFIQHKDLGLDRSFIMTMDVDGRLKNNLAAFKNSLLANASIRAVSASYDSPINIQGGYSLTKAEGQPDGFNMSIAAIPTEKDFTTTMGLTLVAGSALTDADIQQLQPDSASKAEPYYHFTLNESAAKALGWKPETAIGKKITMNGRSGEIKAVVKDFHFASMHEPIAPIILFPEYNYFGKLLVKVAGNSLSAAEAHLQHVWRSYFPQIPFEYHFLDQEFEQLYKAEQRTSWILNCFSVITIFISCLGLLGLSAYTTSQRTKEIGIRKVLGASVNNILQLVAADFLKLVVIAVIVATPLAWWAMSDWLRQFAYRITLSWWLFVVAGLAALSIALVTVSFQSVKAALANPVKSLKNRE